MSKITTRDRISAKRLAGMKWREIGKEWPSVPLGTLCRIHKDSKYEPHKEAIRDALDMPRLALGPVCPVHGKVCAVRHKPPDASRPKRTRPGWGRKPYNRVWDDNTLEW